MIPGAFGWERLHVIAEYLAGLEVRALDVPHHPMEVLGVFISEVSVRIGQHQSPKRAGIGVKFYMGRGGGFFGFYDVT